MRDRRLRFDVSSWTFGMKRSIYAVETSEVMLSIERNFARKELNVRREGMYATMEQAGIARKIL